MEDFLIVTIQYKHLNKGHIITYVTDGYKQEWEGFYGILKHVSYVTILATNI